MPQKAGFDEHFFNILYNQMNIYFFLGFFFIILAEASKKKDLSSFQLDFATNVEYTASDSWKEGFNVNISFYIILDKIRNRYIE